MIAEATWRALGTSARLVVRDGDLAAARAAVDAVLDEVDRTYSRFRTDSELMAVNAAAADGRASVLSPLLARALSGALEAARLSGGAVDPTVGEALRVVGYDRDFALVRDGAGPIELRLVRAPGHRVIRLDPRDRRLRMPRGVELDLGSTGKGLAADLAAAAALRAMTSTEERVGSAAGVLVSLGGDIATAGRPPNGGWRIRLGEDSDEPPDAGGEIVAIDDGAIATSSTTVRRWRTGSGVELHHILDPRTGGPAATPWRTATIAAPTCEAANGASTAAIVLGAAAPAWLEGRRLAARLVANDGAIVRLGGWPEPAAG